MDPSSKAAKQQQLTVSTEADDAFEANLLKTLEINAYDLAALEHYLMDNKYIPASNDEGAIRDAVYKFRKSYSTENYGRVFPDNPRLARLFDAWTNPAVEYWEVEDGANSDEEELNVKARFELTLQRETIKYNAVRTLFARLAARNKSKSGDGGDGGEVS